MKGAINLGNSNNSNRRRCGCVNMARRRWENFPYYDGPCPDVEGRYRWECDCADEGDDREDRRGCDRDDDCRGRRRRRHDCDDDYRGNGNNGNGNSRGNNNGNNGGNNGNGARCCPGRRDEELAKGIFLSYLPMAVAANGIIPLVDNRLCRKSDFDVNSGMITVKEAGTYLATYTVRVPADTALDTTVTLNVDDASQSSAITEIACAGTGTSAYMAQAIFDAPRGATVALRSSAPITMTETSMQPMFTLSLVQLED